jgi:hypothetical protein
MSISIWVGILIFPIEAEIIQNCREIRGTMHLGSGY